jgi:hypothetical protein
MADPTLGFTLAQQGTNFGVTGSSPSQPNPAANKTNPNQSALSSTVLRYPYKKLEKTDDYLKISIMDYEPPGFAEGFVQPTADQQYGNSRILSTIILPIPQNIDSPNATSWNADTMGPLEVAALGVVGGVLEGRPLEALKTASSQSAAALTGSGLTQKAIQAKFAQAAVNQLLGEPGGGAGVLGRTTGAVFNQNIELLFQGVGLRDPFSFSYDLVPRSEKESMEIKEIIRTFKKSMSGKKGGEGSAAGIFIKSPNVFRLEYRSGTKDHPYLNRFKMCALTGMNVNYTGSGTYATYSDATPVHMRLDLSFQELTPIYAEDYDSQEGRKGTGY